MKLRCSAGIDSDAGDGAWPSKTKPAGIYKVSGKDTQSGLDKKTHRKIPLNRQDYNNCSFPQIKIVEG